jgi:hypothetical protein
MAGFDYRQAEEIRDAFATHGVRYLIGKSGAILLGYPDTTQDADLFPDLLDGLWALSQNPVQRLDVRVGLERPPPRRRFIEHAPEREDIRAVIDHLALHLLGRHVADRAEHDPGTRRARQFRARRRVVRPAGRLRQLRQPEVHDLREAVGRDHDVLGLQIAVHDPRRVRLGQPVGCLRQVPHQRLAG